MRAVVVSCAILLVAAVPPSSLAQDSDTRIVRDSERWDLVGNTVPMGGIQALPGCAGLVDNEATLGELLVIKVPSAGSTTDILFDLGPTGGLSIGGANGGDAVNVQWTAPSNFRAPAIGSDVFFVFITHPPEAGRRGARLFVDSGTIANQDFTAATVQVVGESLPGSYGGLAGIDLVLPGDATPYGVRLRGPAGSLTAGFPKGATGGIELAFSPIAEVNNVDLIGGGCTVAGEAADPSDPDMTRGIIAGYNVWRLAGVATSVPVPRDFLDASLDGDPSTGWQAYMPLDGGFDLGRSDALPAGPGTPAPSDRAPDDLFGMQNPDGIMYSGDEVMIFQDSRNNRGAIRETGTAPDFSGATSYWYAVQPVLRGSVEDFAALGFGPGSSMLFGDHRLDLDGDGRADAVDLDLDGTPEFISPQAGAGLPGLGLTHGRLPLLSAPAFGSANPLASQGQATLGGRAVKGPGSRIELTIVTDLEASDVAGYVVDRIDGRTPAGLRVRVNDQPILSGGEGEVLTLVDDLETCAIPSARRIRYELSALTASGETHAVSEITVALPAGRRLRR
jgi:hypothetical protein